MIDRILLFIAVFVLFGSVGMARKAAAGKVDPTKDVRAAFDRLTDGIRQVDVEKLMSVDDKNADILFFNQNGTVTRGWDQMKENRVASFAKIKNVSLDTTGVRVEMLSPTSAYVSFKWKQQQEYDGKLESASGRTTIVFKKIGKDWKAVHLHTSPDNPGPTRPVLDSERVKTDQ